MDALTKAFEQRLAGDTELAGMIADYPAGSGNPAVFTDDRVPSNVPDDAALPYVVTPGNAADEPWDTKTSTGRSVTRDIFIYFPHRHTKDVEAAAERVRQLFYRHRLAVEGARTVVASCSGPTRMSAENFDGRVVTVRLRLTKEQP